MPNSTKGQACISIVTTLIMLMGIYKVVVFELDLSLKFVNVSERKARHITKE
jgi:hypothetical protein